MMFLDVEGLVDGMSMFLWVVSLEVWSRVVAK
jgi:hypothetical protein